MSLEWIGLDVKAGVAEAVLRRAPVNVLHQAMIRELRGALAEAAAHRDARVLLLRGEGKSFCAGVDVAEHLPGKCDTLIAEFHALLRDLMAFEVPTIAQLHGNVLGGGLEVALATDLAYAGAGAKLGQPEIKLGVFPPFAAAFGPSILGARRAAEVVLTGRTYTAPEALGLGLVNGVFPDEQLGEQVLGVARAIASYSRPVLALCKRALHSREASPQDPLREAERIYLKELMSLPDAREGLMSFLERRPPVWAER